MDRTARSRGMRTAWLAVGLVACGLFGEAPPEIGSAVALTAPWATMNLPVEAGTVTMSEPESLTVRHAADAPEPVLQGYAEALTAAGWSMEADTSVPGVINQTWTKEGTTLAVSGLVRDGAVKVSMSILPF